MQLVTIIGFLLATALFPSTAFTRSCYASEKIAYFRCDSRDCSLLFMVRKMLPRGNMGCTPAPVGFYSPHPGFDELSKSFARIGKFSSNRTYEVQFDSGDCIQMHNPDQNGGWNARERLKSYFPENADQGQISAVVADQADKCTKASKVREISPESAAGKKNQKPPPRRSSSFSGDIYIFGDSIPDYLPPLLESDLLLRNHICSDNLT